MSASHDIFAKLFGRRTSNSDRDYQRMHSLSGDFYQVWGDKRPSADEVQELADYNILWKQYFDEVRGKWGLGSIPTQKGFEKWLQRRVVKEVKDND